MVKKITSGSTFEKDIAYSRAVVDENYVFVSGTTGFDYETMTLPESIEEQTVLCFKNIEEALKNAGSSLDHVVRVHYILPNRDDFPACWPIIRENLGVAQPAATMFVAGLMDPNMKIEIEVTARLS
ncbi:RidA family protein [Sneathiella aquimaris]|uniref:RidA family protein n=1 Tax=Sneathiella aquimaris TaxID=2599305 RepID=UPI001469AA29|nr:RidA family protein [Sneathiella aquimaris]